MSKAWAGGTSTGTTMKDKDGDKVRQLRRGLWANVHAKRERGEPPAKPGDKDYPDPKQWRKLSGQRG